MSFHIVSMIVIIMSILKETNQMLVINRYTDPNTLKVTLYGHILKGGTIQQSLGRFDESLLKQVARGYKFYMVRDVLKVPELKTVEIVNIVKNLVVKIWIL